MVCNQLRWCAIFIAIVCNKSNKNCKCLKIWQHQPDIFLVPFVRLSNMGQFPLASGCFLLQHMIFEGFAAHNFAASRHSKTLSSSFAGFQLGHGLDQNRHNLQSYIPFIIFRKSGQISRNPKFKQQLLKRGKMSLKLELLAWAGHC